MPEFREFADENETDILMSKIRELVAKGDINEARRVFENKRTELSENDVATIKELLNTQNIEEDLADIYNNEFRDIDEFLDEPEPIFSADKTDEDELSQVFNDVVEDFNEALEPADEVKEDSVSVEEAVEDKVENIEITPRGEEVSLQDILEGDKQQNGVTAFEEKVAQAKKLIEEGWSKENQDKLSLLYKSECVGKTPAERVNNGAVFMEALRETPNFAQFVRQADEDYIKRTEKAQVDYLKQQIAAPRLDEYAAHEIGTKVLDMEKIILDNSLVPQVKEIKPKEKRYAAPVSRPQTAEMGKKAEKGGFMSRFRDKIEQIKMDYHYAGVSGVFGFRGKDGDGTFLRKGYDSLDGFSHLKELDFGRYPNMTTFNKDYSKIDHVVFPDPKKTPELHLEGCKLKGKVNLSAYNSVSLANADLSMVKELDLTGCKNISLSGIDFSKLDIKIKLPEPITGTLRLSNTKLPKCEKIDLSCDKKGSVELGNTDFSDVNTVVMSNAVSTSSERISGWPKHIDISNCEAFEGAGDMSNVETITTPDRFVGRGARFELEGCQLPNLKSLDVSAYGYVQIANNDMRSLKDITLGGKGYGGGVLYNNRVDALENVKIDRKYLSEGVANIEKGKIFETYNNISRAVKNKQNVYKDAQTGKMCPLSDEQRKAIEVINNSARFYGDGLPKVWRNMQTSYDNPKDLAYLRLGHGDETCDKVLTQYNKVLSQALGLKSYINMETFSYEKTPPLKAGEKVEIPPFSQERFDNIAKLNNRYEGVKGTSRAIEKPLFDKWGTHLNPTQTKVQAKQRGGRS